MRGEVMPAHERQSVEDAIPPTDDSTKDFPTEVEEVVEATTGEELPARASTARNTVIFGGLTGLSRIAGLLREILSANYYGTGGPASAFTIAFLIPNTVRSLFADSALSGAFIPVFSELLEKKKRGEAFRLASTLFMVMFAALSALTVLYIVLAPLIVPLILRLAPEVVAAGLTDLTVGLSQLLFPIVLILGLNGLVVGILQAYDRFTIPALSALVWNIVIMISMVALQPYFDGENSIYAYAIGILIGTIVQFLMSLPVLRKVGFKFVFAFDWKDRRVLEVFALMLPVTIGLGLINLNLFANALIGGQISEQVPAAIDKGFRLYMLPQGIFSVAISTVLFPQLARMAARLDFDGVQRLCAQGLRFIFLLLLPATAALLALAHPMTELIYQRGAFDVESTDLVATGLFWFAFSLPFGGVNLLLTRTFFSLKKPWTVTWLSIGNLFVNVVASLLLLPLGIKGVVMGTVISDAAMAAAQFYYLRRALGGQLKLDDMSIPILKMLVGTVAFIGAAYGTWFGLDQLLGESVFAQIIEVGLALLAGSLVYVGIVLGLKVDEATNLTRMFRERLRSS
ncbi:MAG: murein biosynthesis integral membrane protein MurJ [Thermoleophilaceae bacterium]|nr:murein biosynthesis integral membrane protein MurJ [Thermoleophilaceae bacterium]